MALLICFLIEKIYTYVGGGDGARCGNHKMGLDMCDVM